MQQKLKTWRETLGAGLIASVALHAAVALILLFRLPLPTPETSPDETVQVEMVPDPQPEPDVAPEKEPEPEKQVEAEKQPEPQAEPEQKTEPAAQPEPEVKPAEEPAQAAQAEPEKPAEQPPAETEAKTPEIPPQALESAAKEGGAEAGGDRPAEPQQTPQVDASRDTSAVSGTLPLVTDQSDEPPPQEAPAETPEQAKPPELNLPETANPDSVVNEGEAAIETVPTPQSRPVQEPTEQNVENPDAASTQMVSTEPAAQRPPSELPEMTELFSKEALSNPRIRQALGKLPRNRRIVQICTIEALEQIRHASPQTPPQGLVPFADGGGKVSGQTLTATGGAFVSRRVWRDVSFECTVNDKVEAITSFRFALGSVVTAAQHKARGLPND